MRPGRHDTSSGVVCSPIDIKASMSYSTTDVAISRNEKSIEYLIVRDSPKSASPGNAQKVIWMPESSLAPAWPPTVGCVSSSHHMKLSHEVVVARFP
nr:hypothetical protein CFP56_00652 [Quercus suber]